MVLIFSFPDFYHCHHFLLGDKLGGWLDLPAKEPVMLVSYLLCELRAAVPLFDEMPQSYAVQGDKGNFRSGQKCNKDNAENEMIRIKLDGPGSMGQFLIFFMIASATPDVEAAEGSSGNAFIS